ncbi:MAG: DUF1028 domain-containing protein [Anaerolineaceae bacterium]|nr:DUF1028 domain-containing protein [Anaerolineaceae bacterium]
MPLNPRFPFAHTFSIVARDPKTREMGVAVQSHWFSTGSIVTWAEPGVGVVATQSLAEISYGPLGLFGMQTGKPVSDVLKHLLEKDENPQVRQVAMINSTGEVAAHTGSRCIAEAGHQIGHQYSVQANMMLNNTVWPAMAEAYEAAKGKLADRLLAALDAAQAAGGDLRGQQSAAMLVVSGDVPIYPWKGILVDLRVEDHTQPLAELRRLLGVQRAYEHMNKGDELMGQGKVDQALIAYEKAVKLAPHLDELPFWQAVTLLDGGREEEAFPILRNLFSSNPNWLVLLERLPAAGLLRDDAKMMQRVRKIFTS